MHNQETERLLTRAEVEDKFGISKRYLETAVCRGDGPKLIRIGRSVRYHPKDVRDWIEANTTGGFAS
jgi:predicted DNA-binding transcriptional regulator AlpA